MTTGRSIFNPHAVRVRSYPVAVEPADCGPDVAVETYPVSVERKMVVLRGVTGAKPAAPGGAGKG